MKQKYLVGSLPILAAALFFGMSAEAADAEMHRLYNPNTGEHFYTANTEEKDGLVKAGWEYENIGWIAPENGEPVYRLYNPNAGDHHYTMSAEERDGLIKAGWDDEKIGWYSSTDKEVPIYRAYNPNAETGTHNYTASEGEQKSLIKAGWDDEKIGWYGVNKTYTVTVKFTDEDGKQIKDDVTGKVVEGNNYTINAPAITGYEVKGDSKYTLTNVKKDETYTFKYSKLAEFEITVQYKLLEADGTNKVEEEKKVGYKGQDFTAEAKEIAGYTLQGDKTQTISKVDKAQTITFTYKSAKLIEKEEAEKGYVPLTDEYIASNAFRTYLQAKFPSKIKDNVIDTNGITRISVSSSNISTLKGIEYFKDVTELKCSDNQLTELNISNLTKLEILSCDINQLTTLDVSKLVNLKELNCASNQLTKLDVTGLNKLITRPTVGNQAEGFELIGWKN